MKLSPLEEASLLFLARDMASRLPEPVRVGRVDRFGGGPELFIENPEIDLNPSDLVFLFDGEANREGILEVQSSRAPSPELLIVRVRGEVPGAASGDTVWLIRRPFVEVLP